MTNQFLIFNDFSTFEYNDTTYQYQIRPAKYNYFSSYNETLEEAYKQFGTEDIYELYIPIVRTTVKKFGNIPEFLDWLADHSNIIRRYNECIYFAPKETFVLWKLRFA